LKLELGIGSGSSVGKSGRVVLAAASAVPPTMDGIVLTSSSMLPLAKGKRGDEEASAKIKAVVVGSVAALGVQARLLTGPEINLLRILAEPKHQHLAPAIEITAGRQTKAAVPQLIRLLDHEDERIGDRAIGALVSIGDQRAVKPLTRYGKFQGTKRIAKVIDGVAMLGGGEAVDYLSFVAVAHDDPDIRNLAREALQRMGRRRD
jgi:HEAT repeat protein